MHADEGMKVNMIIALNSQPIRLKNNLKYFANLVIFDPATFFGGGFLFNNFDHCSSWGNFSSGPLRKN